MKALIGEIFGQKIPGAFQIFRLLSSVQHSEKFQMNH